IADWQVENLSAGALARIQLVDKGAIASTGAMIVAFPNGETRRLAQGPSSVITKAVVEEFTGRFLIKPGVIFLSESRNKTVARDDARARAIGIVISADRFLPDILLVDLGPKNPLLVFVEVVATDGPVSASRKAAFLQITTNAGFTESQVAFVTAYLDRGQPAFKKTASEISWNSFVWFVSEPDHLIILREGREGKASWLFELL
ncbi:MAG: restriction endonuclease, partial [Acidobacteria bacterium]|nr:restriction endonuclease [Acidobacteriota bacterium]